MLQHIWAVYTVHAGCGSEHTSLCLIVMNSFIKSFNTTGWQTKIAMASLASNIYCDISLTVSHWTVCVTKSKHKVTCVHVRVKLQVAWQEILRILPLESRPFMFGPCLHLEFFHHSLTFLCWPRLLDFTQSSDLCEVTSCPLLLHISGHPSLKQLIFAHIYCDCCNNTSKHTTCYVGSRLPMVSNGNSVPS